MNEPLLTVESVTKRYRLPRQQLWTAAPEVQAQALVPAPTQQGVSEHFDRAGQVSPRIAHDRFDREQCLQSIKRNFGRDHVWSVFAEWLLDDLV